MRRKRLVLGIISACTLLVLSMGLKTHAGTPFYRAETEHFIVYSDADQSSTRDYVSKLESFYVTASSLYYPVSDGAINYKQKPTFLYIKSLQDDYVIFPQLKKGLANGGSFALYNSCLDGETNAYTDAAFMSDYYDGDYRFVSLNIYVKRIYMSRTLPDWVSVGLYSYVLNADIQKEKIVVGKPSAWQTLGLGTDERAGLLTKYVPFSQIIDDNVTSPKDSSSLKAQYWLMMVYMMSTAENREKLYNYVELVSSGRSSGEAFKEAIGLEPAFFENLIKQYKTKGFPVIEFKVSALDPKTYKLEKLPDYSEPVPLLSAASQACHGSEYGDEIINRLQKVASEMPDDRYAQRELARSQILLGQVTSAKAYIEGESNTAAADYDFKYLEGRYYLGLAEAGGPDADANFAKARSNLGKAYKLNPTSGPILYYYARAFENQADFPNANTIMAVRQANEALQGPYQSYLNALLIKTGQMVDEATQLIEKKPTIQAYTDRAFARPDSEKQEKLADIEAAMRLGPDSDLPYLARARFYLKYGDTASALNDANKALELNPDTATGLETRAKVYLKMSKPEQALKDLDRSVSQNKGVASLNGACWTLATQDYADKAMSYCNRAVSQTPNAPNVFDSRALAELKLNQLDAAIEDYSRALSLNPNLPTSWYGRGLAKIKQGKNDEGQRDIARAIYIDPVMEMEFTRDMGIVP